MLLFLNKSKSSRETKNFRLGLVYCCSKAYNLVFGFGSLLCVVLHAVPVWGLPSPATLRVETKTTPVLGVIYVCDVCVYMFGADGL